MFLHGNKDTVKIVRNTMLREHHILGRVGHMPSVHRVSLTPVGRNADRIRAGDLGQEPLGHFSRRVFKELRLKTSKKYPRQTFLHWPGFGAVLDISRGIVCTSLLSSRVKNLSGKGLWSQIKDMWLLRRHENINPVTYYMSELYEPSGYDDAAALLTRYETKNGLIRALNKYALGSSTSTHKPGDKLDFSVHCLNANLPAIPVLMLIGRKEVDIFKNLPTDFERDLFVKPRSSRGAVGATSLQWLGNGRYRDHTGKHVSIDTLQQYCLKKTKARPALVLPRLQNHPDLMGLADRSLIVIRVLTILDHRDMPTVTHAMLRILSKLEPGWPTKAEFAAPIDLKTGKLGLLTSDLIHHAADRWKHHPITGAQVLGRSVPFWQEVMKIARAAHQSYANYLVIGWDVAVTPDGVRLVEGNPNPDVGFLQRVHRQPLGNSSFAPFFRYRLRQLAYGKIDGAF